MSAALSVVKDPESGKRVLKAVWLCLDIAIMRRLFITCEMSSRNCLSVGDCKPVYAADFGNVLEVKDTLKGFCGNVGVKFPCMTRLAATLVNYRFDNDV